MSAFNNMKEIVALKYSEVDKESSAESEKVQKVILVTSAICAGVAVQPLPFADIAILTPIQAFMAVKIGKAYGFDVTTESAAEILKELAGIVGMGWIAQQTVIGIYKLGLPFVGGLFTIPLVFGLTYGIGKVTDYYFHQKALGQPIDKKALKLLWQKMLREGKRIGQENENDIKDGKEGVTGEI